MTHINEDKRKAEGQVTLFNIFNDIDNCPVSMCLFLSSDTEFMLYNNGSYIWRGNFTFIFFLLKKLFTSK